MVQKVLEGKEVQVVIRDEQVFRELGLKRAKGRMLSFFNNKDKKVIICYCGKEINDLDFYHRPTCPSCGANQEIYIWKNKYGNKNELIMSSYFDVQTKNEKELVLKRYDLICKVDREQLSIDDKYVLLRGFINYNYDDEIIHAHILKKNGKYGRTKNITRLTSVGANDILNYPTFNSISIEELQKCIYLYLRTGLKEFLDMYGMKDAFNCCKVKDILTYLDYYKNKNNPEIELILKTEKNNLARELIFNNVDINEHLNRTSKASKIFNLPSYVQSSCKNLSLDEFKILEKIHEKGKGISKESLQYMKNHSLIQIYYLRKIYNLIGYGYSLREICNYLEKADLYQAIEPSYTLDIWIDYVRMATETEVPYHRFSNSLKKDHDLMVREYKFMQNKITNEKYENIKKEFNKYAYSNNDYSIIVPENPNDIVKEGKILRHCVASYINDIIKGKTIILFLRENKQLDEPFYTIEVNDDKVVQLRGFSNKLIDSENVKSFIDEWCKKKNITILRQ